MLNLPDDKIDRKKVLVQIKELFKTNDFNDLELKDTIEIIKNLYFEKPSLREYISQYLLTKCENTTNNKNVTKNYELTQKNYYLFEKIEETKYDIPKLNHVNEKIITLYNGKGEIIHIV